MTVWDDIAAERVLFAELVEGLDDAQLATPSLCGEWTVHEVAAHVVMPLITGKAAIAKAMLRARGNFHRANAALAKATAQRPAAELAAALRKRAASHFTPPLHPPATPLTDLLIHGQDVRRPLGYRARVRRRPAARRRWTSWSPSARTPDSSRKGRSDGLRLRRVRPGLDVRRTAPRSAGPARRCCSALTGRDVALAELSGDGVAALARRINCSPCRA